VEEDEEEDKNNNDSDSSDSDDGEAEEKAGNAVEKESKRKSNSKVGACIDASLVNLLGWC
jgi:hypothetical protein